MLNYCTECPLYHVHKHGSCSGMYRQMQAFCVIKLLPAQGNGSRDSLYVMEVKIAENCVFGFFVYRPRTHWQPGCLTSCPGVKSHWMPPWDTRPPPHSTGLSLRWGGKSLWRVWRSGALPSLWQWVKKGGTWRSDCSVICVCWRQFISCVYRCHCVFRSIWVSVVMDHGTSLCDEKGLQMLLFEMPSSLKFRMLLITWQRTVMSFEADTFVVCSQFQVLQLCLLLMGTASLVSDLPTEGYFLVAMWRLFSIDVFRGW